MIQKRHLKEAKRIGDDSWDLLHWQDLRRNASPEQQIEALRADQRWLLDHYYDTIGAIDDLIYDIESGSEED